MYTVDGRLVSRIWEGPLHEGDTPFHWDGKDSVYRKIQKNFTYYYRLMVIYSDYYEIWNPFEF